MSSGILKNEHFETSEFEFLHKANSLGRVSSSEGGCSILVKEELFRKRMFGFCKGRTLQKVDVRVFKETNFSLSGLYFDIMIGY